MKITVTFMGYDTSIVGSMIWCSCNATTRGRGKHGVLPTFTPGLIPFSIIFATIRSLPPRFRDRSLGAKHNWTVWFPGSFVGVCADFIAAHLSLPPRLSTFVAPIHVFPFHLMSISKANHPRSSLIHDLHLSSSLCPRHVCPRLYPQCLFLAEPSTPIPTPLDLVIRDRRTARS